MRSDRDALGFDGAPEFLTWLFSLARRPRPFRAEEPLPLVHVRTAEGSAYAFLSALHQHWTKHRLRGARRIALVPATRTAEGDADGRSDEERLLASAAVHFFQRRRGRRLGPGARHFALASWLVSLRREATDRTSDADRPSLSEKEVSRQLRAHFAGYEIVHDEGGRTHRSSVPLAAISDLPWWIKLPAFLVPLASSIAAILFGPHKWFEHRGGRRQQRDAELLTGSLLDLARRFAGLEGEAPSESQIRSLLTDALLEDLRRAHGKKVLFGRLRRGPTHPVLLLECEGGEAAVTLLKTIAEVRNARPRRGPFKRDPLLVVAAGPQSATDIDPRVPDVAQAGSPETAYEDWRRNLEERYAKRERVWLLPFELPEASPAPTIHDRVRRTRPPLRIPWTSFAAIAALVAGLIAVPVTSYEFCRPLWSPSVALWPPGIRDDLRREQLPHGDDQCVGLADGIPPLVSRELDQPLDEIAKYNAKAESDPDHLTVVHLTMFSPGTDQGVRATREELRGIAIAQRETLGLDVPVRLLLANAGARMQFADVAAEEIVDAKHRGERIAAVVGLGLSTHTTIEAVRILGREGIASVGSATTAEGLAQASQFYYQVSPDNNRQAQFAARHAKDQLHARRARIYHSADPKDIYSAELAQAMEQELTNAQVHVVEKEGYRVTADGPGERVHQLGRNACQATQVDGEIVVYTGRAEEFEDFLVGMRSRCQNQYPQILAADDVSRFVLTGRSQNYPELKLEYIMLASSAMWGVNCERTRAQSNFYKSYEELFGRACDENRDGRALLTYDALTVVRQAATNVLARDAAVLDKQGIAAGMHEISGRGEVTGVSGDLDYSDPDNPQIPVEKAILLLRATSGQPCLVTAEGKFSPPEVKPDCPASG